MSLSILVVEDHDLSRVLVTDILEEAGHVVYAATSARSLRQLVKALPRIDLVLLDLQLPDGSGRELFAELGAGPLAAVPVVALTAYTLPEEAARLLAAGFRAVLTKPIDTHTFVAVLEQLVAAGPRSVTPP